MRIRVCGIWLRLRPIAVTIAMTGLSLAAEVQYADERVTVPPGSIAAVSGKQVVVGEHDFEFINRTFDRVPFSKSSVWKAWLTEDYSGKAEYQFEFDVPKRWANSPLELSTGSIEYAASVCVDGTKAGTLLWPPWRVSPPPFSAGKHAVSIRVANTLANELTSPRVTDEWAKKSGPGWPGPYHKRALEFERESRGGGITDPIRIRRLAAD